MKMYKNNDNESFEFEALVSKATLVLPEAPPEIVLMTSNWT